MMPSIRQLKNVACSTEVYDKFHLVKKLSDTINKTRQKEVKTEPLLKEARFAVLKNEENRTIKHSSQFDAINNANLLTAQAWRVRENFKRLFELTGYLNLIEVYDKWLKNALQKGVKYLVDVVKTFERHLEGIFNATLYKTTSVCNRKESTEIYSPL